MVVSRANDIIPQFTVRTVVRRVVYTNLALSPSFFYIVESLSEQAYRKPGLEKLLIVDVTFKLDLQNKYFYKHLADFNGPVKITFTRLRAWGVGCMIELKLSDPEHHTDT